MQETLPNMLNQIRRLSAIVNKLSGIKEYVEVTLRLKITNDFVMALLSRSSSIEILAPPVPQRPDVRHLDGGSGAE